MHIRGHRDFPLFAGLDLERVERIHISFDVDDAPGGCGRVRHLEIGRDAQDALAVFDSVSDGSLIGLRAFEFRGGVWPVTGGE